jgi:uncharacterized protein (UPF0335 family)
MPTLRNYRIAYSLFKYSKILVTEFPKSPYNFTFELLKNVKNELLNHFSTRSEELYTTPLESSKDILKADIKSINTSLKQFGWEQKILKKVIKEGFNKITSPFPRFNRFISAAYRRLSDNFSALLGKAPFSYADTIYDFLGSSFLSRCVKIGICLTSVMLAYQHPESIAFLANTEFEFHVSTFAFESIKFFQILTLDISWKYYNKAQDFNRYREQDEEKLLLQDIKRCQNRDRNLYKSFPALRTLERPALPNTTRGKASWSQALQDNAKIYMPAFISGLFISNIVKYDRNAIFEAGWNTILGTLSGTIRNKEGNEKFFKEINNLKERENVSVNLAGKELKTYAFEERLHTETLNRLTGNNKKEIIDILNKTKPLSYNEKKNLKKEYYTIRHDIIRELKDKYIKPKSIVNEMTEKVKEKCSLATEVVLASTSLYDRARANKISWVESIRKTAIQEGIKL